MYPLWWKPNFHYLAHISPQLALSLSHIISVHALPSHVSNISFNIIPIYVPFLNILFPSVVPTKILCELLISLIRAKFPVHLTLLDSQHPNKIFSKNSNHAARHYAIIFHPLVNSSLSGPNNPLCTLISNVRILCAPLNVKDQDWHPYTQHRILCKQWPWKGRNFTLFEWEC